MATLVLSSAGSALAGPLGGAIGGMVGSEVDRTLFGSPGRQLPDLRLQTSSYGQAIPAIHGRMRVAGTVIWASELVETAMVGKAGGGLSYSVSFAVAISSRPIASVKRIWADGRLIRGRAGDHKIPFSFRLQSGEDDQEADPLIAAAEGAGRAPAHRGLSVVVFEDFDLSTFGNRIPQLNMEVEAAAAPPTAEALVTEALDLAHGNERIGDVISGVGLDGDDASECIRPVVETFGLTFGLRDGRWELDPSPICHRIDWRELQSIAIDASDAPSLSRASDGELPTKISLSYFDETLDFATGEKVARLPGPSRPRRILFPGSLTSDQAKGLASASLSRAWAHRTELDVALPLRHHTIAVGDCLILPDRGDRPWKVVRKRLGPVGLSLTVRAIAADAADLPSESGRGAKASDDPPQSLRLEVIELPPDGEVGRPAMVVAACGGPSPWITPRIEVSTGERRFEIAGPRKASMIGELVSPLPPSSTGLFDDRNDIFLRLPGGFSLTSATDAALLAGENLAWVGGEVLRFGIVEQIEDDVYRLRHLLRGLFDSGAAGHAIGAPFVVLHPGRLSGVDIPADHVGERVTVRMTAADGQADEAFGIFRAQALMPWRPAHVRVLVTGDHVRISWVRCGPGGLAWLDNASDLGTDAAAIFRVRLMGESGQQLEATVSGPQWNVSKNEMKELGEGPWSFEVAELGSHGLGPAASAVIEERW